MKDRDVLFHEKWLGLAQPIEGLVFSVPVLADAQIAPEERAALSTAFAAQLDAGGERIRSLPAFLRDFLGYTDPGMIVPRGELPEAISFYAAEGGQEIRPTYALGAGPFGGEDPFAAFEESSVTTGSPRPAPAAGGAAYWALVWDLTEHGADIDLDAPEEASGRWRYPPTAKLERLLRQVGIPVGLLFNGRALRLVYAPAGESTGHLTFRVEHMRTPEGRPLLTALDLLLHARRAYTAAPEHTLPGLLAESRRRQADVTEELAKQVFEAVEILLAGFEAAAVRDCAGGAPDWLEAALGEEGDHLYQGVLSVVLRLVFLLYAEDQALLPVEHRVYAEHLGLGGLHARLGHDAGAHPESMHHRFGAYGQLLSLFRAVFYGVQHGSLTLPPRRGRLFDPNAYPFLEGGLPGWTAALKDPEARAAARPPSVDDGTVHRVMHRLVVFAGQRLSYRTLDVVQIGSIYESLMGYHVRRVESPAVRIGKHGVWVEAAAIGAMGASDRARFLKETCGLNPGPIQAIEKAAKEGAGPLLDALAAHAPGKRGDPQRHRVEAGRLVLQPGEERRRTGTHYTPASLTEKVVKRTLDPLLACLGEAPPADRILELKICDPAMGSGAFLVAACRALASEVVAAWTRAGKLAEVLEEHGDAHLHARRLVAQTCLYGVDRNAAAVELAKLSLWLVTMSRSLPFTFVDHALRHGDSLVGLDFDQIRCFHWARKGQVETCAVLLDEALAQAVGLRQDILRLAEHEDARSQDDKRRLLEFSQQAIEKVRVAADACVGAFFAEEKEAAREKERKRRLGLVESWIGFEKRAEAPGRTEEERAKDLALSQEAGAELRELARQAREKLVPFHWWIEFPEVFFAGRKDPLLQDQGAGAADMDAVIGNPPFMAKNAIVATGGRQYVPWLLQTVEDSHGNADMCAYFFRRAGALIGDHGTVGLIATNTISQGDTRRSGLGAMLQRGFEITYAERDMPWPGDAAVIVSWVVLARGAAACHEARVLDGVAVANIDSRLRPSKERSAAQSLPSMRELFFVGSKVYGKGFFLTPDEAATLLADPHNAEVVQSAIGGEDVTTDPQLRAPEFVITFGQRSLDAARAWPQILAIVESRVRPERELANDATADGAHRKKYWWQHAQPRPELYSAISGLRRCLVTANVCKHMVFAFQPIDRLFSQQLFVFPFDAATSFAVLQSRIHECWARLLSSTMKTDLRYSASDCFETFPFPQPDPRAIDPALEDIGERLYTARASYMVDTHQGLTKTYNALKDPTCTDPRILDLRRLHEDLDRAVLAAYGWGEIPVPPYCPLSDEDRAALQAFEDEVIDRLYVLNADRAREEQRLGHAPKAAARPAEGDEEEAAPAPAKKGRGRKAPEKQGKLF